MLLPALELLATLPLSEKILTEVAGQPYPPDGGPRLL